MAQLRNVRTIEDVMKHIEKRANGCWHWKHIKTTEGYGVAMFRSFPHRKMETTHRLMMMFLHKRWLGPKEYVCHKCDDKACCNPDHLYIGDAKTNMRDRAEKEANLKKNPPPPTFASDGFLLTTPEPSPCQMIDDGHRDGQRDGQDDRAEWMTMQP
jgi:hypothetical protein